MTKINGTYNGNLRCELSHPSNTIIHTDAPKDNRGEGKFFSPTDLLAASLASCILTIVGIRARDKGIDIGNPSFQVNKAMASNPRMVAKLKVEIIYDVPIPLEERAYLEEEGRNCPVALSLAESIQQELSFQYA